MPFSQQKRGYVLTRTFGFTVAGKGLPVLGLYGARGWSGTSGSWTREVRAPSFLPHPFSQEAGV